MFHNASKVVLCDRPDTFPLHCTLLGLLKHCAALQLHYTTTSYNYTTPHITTLFQRRERHQWIHSSIHASQQRTSPKISSLWNFCRLVQHYTVHGHWTPHSTVYNGALRGRMPKTLEISCVTKVFYLAAFEFVACFFCMGMDELFFFSDCKACFLQQFTLGHRRSHP